MFFVGATGQLLTLILTVSLPLVFLVSGHQKIDVQQNKLNFEIQQNYLKISSFENDTFDYFLNYFTEYQCTVFFLLKIPTSKKFHLKKLR